MKRMYSRSGYAAMAISLIMTVLSSNALAQTGIFVSPEEPAEVDSLEITINAVSLTFPVWVDSTSVEITEGSIKITTELTCGIMYMIEPYTITVTLAPVEAGTYAIEYWSNEDCHLGSNPILSSEIVVSPEPIATENSTWGVIKSLRK